VMFSRSFTPEEKQGRDSLYRIVASPYATENDDAARPTLSLEAKALLYERGGGASDNNYARDGAGAGSVRRQGMVPG